MSGVLDDACQGPTSSPAVSLSGDSCLILCDPYLDVEAWSKSGIFLNFSFITPSGCLRGMGRKGWVLHLNAVWEHPHDALGSPRVPSPSL